jgi:hypothetical protein
VGGSDSTASTLPEEDEEDEDIDMEEDEEDGGMVDVVDGEDELGEEGIIVDPKLEG